MARPGMHRRPLDLTQHPQLDSSHRTDIHNAAEDLLTDRQARTLRATSTVPRLGKACGHGNPDQLQPDQGEPAGLARCGCGASWRASISTYSAIFRARVSGRFTAPSRCTSA
jgi:hypothetical protein